MEQPEQQEPRSNKALHLIYLSIILVLAGLSGFLGWQFQQLSSQVQTQTVVVTEMQDKNDDIQDELESLSQQFEDLKTNDVALQKELDEKKAYIEELKKEAAKNKNNAGIIAKLRKETVTLRAIMQSYIRTIDSMGQLNQTLRTEKTAVLGQLDEERGRTTNLETEKQRLQGRIDKAALLPATGVHAMGIREKRSGARETETTKASRVDKLKVSFDIARNDLTIPGAKDIYIRVITPDGQELTPAMDADHRISYNGGTTYFAARKSIDYQNQPMSVLVYCPKANADYVFLPGRYIIEVIADKAQIGRTEFALE